ncbi:hypothetical protein J4218_04935 [Candidatus Pacearchaeota archaeon]|nr:hypothetical protein [Candidatus Pacearchaeota archaeon]
MKTWLKGGLYGILAWIITLIVIAYAYLFSHIPFLMKIFSKLLSFTDKSSISTGIVIVSMDLVILFITGIIIGFLFEIFKKINFKKLKLK